MNRPMVYLTLSYIVGLVSGLLILENELFIAGLIIILFIIVIWLNEKVNTVFFCSVVIFLGFINISVYYNYSNYPNGTHGDIRVLEDRSTYYKVKLNHKLYVMEEDNLSELNIKEGSLIKGEFFINNNPELYKGIIGTIEIKGNPKITNDFISSMYNVREGLYSKFSEVLGKERAGIVNGLCFGNTKYLEEEVVSDFKGLGIIHVVSVSGFHIILIYNLFRRIMGKKIALFLVLFFVIFTGSQASTLRAFIMLLILSIADIAHKNYDSITAICISALVILFMRPYLITDLGFNLSCLSTLGIILFNKKVNRTLYRLPDRIRESISLTISSQLIVFTYGSLMLKTFSTGFILGNLLIIPIYTAIIYVSLFSILFMRIDLIFSLINKINLLLFAISDSWFYILSLLGLSESAISEEIVIMYTILFISFILVKGKKLCFKYLPIIMLPAVMLYNYKFFPTIHLMELGNSRYIEVEYKRDKYFFTLGKGDNLREKLKYYSGNKKTISLKDRKYMLKLGNNIIRINTHDNTKKAVALRIGTIEENTTTEVYDIISMDKTNISYDFYRRQRLKSYYTIGNKVFIFNKDGGSQVVRYRQTRK